jgi:hypothetical protein
MKGFDMGVKMFAENEQQKASFWKKHKGKILAAAALAGLGGLAYANRDAISGWLSKGEEDKKSNQTGTVSGTVNIKKAKTPAASASATPPPSPQAPRWGDLDGEYAPQKAILGKFGDDINDQHQMLDALEKQIKGSPRAEDKEAIGRKLKGLADNAKFPYVKTRAKDLYKELYGMNPLEDLDDRPSGHLPTLEEIKKDGDAVIRAKKQAQLAAMTEDKKYESAMTQKEKYVKLCQLADDFKAHPYLNSQKGDSIYSEAERLAKEIAAMPVNDYKSLAASKMEFIRALADNHQDESAPAEYGNGHQWDAEDQGVKYYRTVADNYLANGSVSDMDDIKRTLDRMDQYAKSLPFGKDKWTLDEKMAKLRTLYGKLVEQSTPKNPRKQK